MKNNEQIILFLMDTSGKIMAPGIRVYVPKATLAATSSGSIQKLTQELNTMRPQGTYTWNVNTCY